ncbi:MAG: rhamnogalacturonan acetylesterase [Phycisphaerae bacterium]
MKPHHLLSLAALLLLAPFTPAQTTTPTKPTTPNPSPLRIVIVGDSTVSVYPDNVPTRGWGMYIQDFFQPNTVQVIDLAASGRSSKTFISEGRWAKALAEKPNYVFIQFGHNDSHPPTRHEATNPNTDFKTYLRQYIDDARNIHATPILITPMARRVFDNNGKISDVPPPPGGGLLPYCNAMKEVAKEKDVPLIDLHSASVALFEKLGPDASAKLANKPGDSTHFNEQGARDMASLVIQQLPHAAPDLAHDLKSQ